MAKANIEKASDAWVNPPTPQDPTSDVTRNASSSGEPLHKPPQADSDHDDDGDGNAVERPRGGDKPAAVPSTTGRDYRADGHGGVATNDAAERWRDDPMPDGAQERMDWVQRGTDTKERLNAAIAAEEARGAKRRPTVLSGLRTLQQEHHQNERHESSEK